MRPPMKLEISPIKVTPPLVPCEIFVIIKAYLSSQSYPGYRTEAGDQPGVSPPEDGAQLCGPGVPGSGRERAQDCTAEPASSVLVSAKSKVMRDQVTGQTSPEVYGKVR